MDGAHISLHHWFYGKYMMLCVRVAWPFAAPERPKRWSVEESA